MALLFAGVDEKGPQLYHMDPSGTYIRYEAKAIGSGSEGAQQALQEVYHKVRVVFYFECTFIRAMIYIFVYLLYTEYDFRRRNQTRIKYT